MLNEYKLQQSHRKHGGILYSNG